MRPTLSFLLLASVAISMGQSKPYAFPFELEAHRKPTVQANGRPVLIKGAKVMTAGPLGTFAVADVLIENGKIIAIGKDVNAPAGALIIEGAGKVVTPGIVDGHIHRGSDATNEGSDSITADVRIEDVLNLTQRNVWAALAGGETTGMILHGSANAVGGQSTVVKLKYGRPAWEGPIPDAPRMIKFALGENVTRSQSATPTRWPRTRMGVQALYRRAFTEAKEYNAAWDAYEKGGRVGKAPRRDIRLETLGDILKGKVWVQCHSYRADEMLMMVRLSQEFGFKLANLQHALEAYKIAPEMAKAGISASMFVDNWSFKLEGYDGIPYNAWLTSRAGVNVSINTDGTSGMPSLIIDAAKPMRYGGMTDEECLKMVTINPAKSLGVAHRTGSLEVGKDGDVAIWDGHPLSVYSKCQMTLIEGEVYFQRRDAFEVDKLSPAKQDLPKNEKRAVLQIPEFKKAYVIRGADVYPVSGRPFKGDVRMEGERITAVGPSVSTRDAHVVEGRGLSVYPGFIDAGNSMGLAELSPVSESIDTTELGGGQPDLIASTAIQMQSEHFPTARLGGVLVSLVRPTGGTVSGQASVVANEGWTTEDMRIGQDLLVVNFGGGGGGGFGYNREDDCCMDMRGGFDPTDPLAPHDHDHNHEPMGGASLAVIAAAAAQGASELDSLFTRVKAYKEKRDKTDLQMEAMIPYVDGQKRILVRVRSAAQIRAAVDWAQKQKVKIVLSGAPDAWKEAALLKSANVPVILNPAGRSTLSANAPANDWDPYDTPFATPYLLAKAGVKFAFQSDDNSGSVNLPVRVGQSCAYGLTIEQAVRALTLDAAEILGAEKEIGSIEPNKLATVLISDGDPFELTTNIVGGFIKGRPMGMTSRFTRLRDQWGRRILNQ